MKYLVLFLILSLSYIPFGQNTKGSGAVWLVAQAHAASPKARAKTENVKARKQPPRSYKSKATAKGKSAGTRKTNLKPRGYIRYSSAKAGSANYRLKKAMPTIKAPYKHGSSVYSFKTRKNEKFVRVYAEGKSQPAGKWLVRAKEIKGLSPAQVQQKLALPFKPTHYVNVNVPKGTKLSMGIAAGKNFGGRRFSGGGIQYELRSNINFPRKGNKLPEKGL